MTSFMQGSKKREAKPISPSLSIVRGLLVLRFPGHIWRDGIGFHWKPGLCAAGAPQIQFHALYAKHLPSAWSDFVGRSDGCERESSAPLSDFCVFYSKERETKKWAEEKKKQNQETASVSLRERTDLRSLKISRSHRLFDCFDPKMVRGNKVTDKLFQTRAPLNGVLSHSPFFHLLENTPQMTKKLSAPTVFQSEDRTRFGGKITQDSSSRARNLKHPAMCTASSGAPGGGWDGCQSPRCVVTLFLLSADKASTDTACIWRLTPLAVGLCGYTQRAPVWLTPKRFCLVAEWMWQKCALYRHLHRLGRQSDSKDVSQGNRQLRRVLRRRRQRRWWWWWSASVAPPKDELIVGSKSMVVEVPRGCKHDEKHLLQLNTGMTKPTISLVTSMAWIA